MQIDIPIGPTAVGPLPRPTAAGAAPSSPPRLLSGGLAAVGGVGNGAMAAMACPTGVSDAAKEAALFSHSLPFGSEICPARAPAHHEARDVCGKASD